MVREPLPVLRCESRRSRPDTRWAWIAAGVMFLATSVDALWLVPAQRDARAVVDLGPRYRCVELAAPRPAPSPKPTPRVEGILLLRAPTR